MSKLMLTVDEALSIILRKAKLLPSEKTGVADMVGRIAATDITAELTQPPFPASAMDGYAVRFADTTTGEKLKVIGESRAGTPFQGNLAKDEAVRIFTGGVVPSGADHIVIQEDICREGDEINITASQPEPRHIRPAGIDFRAGDVLVRAAERLHELHGSLLAAANIREVNVIRRPRVALFANGDELVDPGTALAPGQIVNSNHYGLAAMLRSWGAEPAYLGRAADDLDEIVSYFQRGLTADIIVPIGGASVGDHDHVRTAFQRAGGELAFEKVAVRPGKPTWAGHIGSSQIIGLPGNPASAIVTAALFLQPLVHRLGGLDTARHTTSAILTKDLPANGPREHYMRAVTGIDANGRWAVTPAENQDSSLLLPFSFADALIRRKPEAPAASIGDEVDIIWLRRPGT